jgi:hypothetical protein
LRSGWAGIPANADFTVVAHFSTPLDAEKLAANSSATPGRPTGKPYYKFTDREKNRPAYFFTPNSSLLVLGCMPEAQIQMLAASTGVPSEQQQALAGDSSSLVWAVMPSSPANAPHFRTAFAKSQYLSKLQGLSMQVTTNGDGAGCSLQFQFPDQQTTGMAVQELNSLLSSLGKPASSPPAGKDKDADRTRTILANLKVTGSNGNRVIVEGSFSRADLLTWIGGDTGGGTGAGRGG